MLESPALTFHHVGVACRDIGRDRARYEALGFRDDGAVFEDPTQRIRGLFLINDTYRVELLEALEPGAASPLAGYLDRGARLYHQAFLTADLDRSSAALRADGAVVTVEPVPAVAFGGRQITFLMLRNMNLIELIAAP